MFPDDAPMDHPDGRPLTPEEAAAGVRAARKELTDQLARSASTHDQLDADVEKHGELIALAASKGPAVVREQLGEKNFLVFVHLLALKVDFDRKREQMRDLLDKFRALPSE